MSGYKDFEGLFKENEKLKSDIEWYKRTYEKRSYLGLQKEYLSRKIKVFVYFLLRLKFINKRKTISHILLFIGKYGIIKFISSLIFVIKENGLSSIFRLKKIIKKDLILNKVNFESSVLNYKVKCEDNQDKDELIKQIERFAKLPKISFILPVYNTKTELLKIAISSIYNQIYKNWEVCIVDDCSTKEEVRAVLNDYRRDKRFKIKFLENNVGISECSNVALKMADGDFVALIDHDDEITEDALFWVVKEINENENVDIIYTDECKADEHGNLSDYFYKPDWSPELLINMMYVGHLTVYRKSFLNKEVGYFRKEFDFSQDYDLMLWAVEKARSIRHIRKVLYHWRITEGSAAYGDKSFARRTNLAALDSAMKRRNIDAEIIELPTANRVKINFDKNTFVSIIIPSDSFNNIKETVESIVKNTNYLKYELIIVTNSSLKEKLKKEFKYSNLTFVCYDLPYNFSCKCNLGVKYSKGEIVVFFNDDVRPLQKDWLENTIEFLFVSGIGGVSPKLIYTNDTIQYAGMATGVRNLIGTTLHCFHKDSVEYINYPQLVRNVSILSGACLAMKKTVFEEINGFDEINTPIANSDVDLSFKIMEKGMRCIYTPYATLRHIGHFSIGETEETEIKKDKSDIYLLKKWIKYTYEDKYFTPKMKEYLYHDSREPFQIFPPDNKKVYGRKGDLLFVSHDLTQSGAPISIFDLCKSFVSKGYFATVVSPSDGIVREMYQKIGVPVIIDELIFRQHESVSNFAKNFDCVLCNTIVTWPVVKQLSNLTKVIWYIQEAQVLDLFINNQDCVSTLKNAKNIVGLSDYSLSYIKKYNSNVSKIYNSCYDIYEENRTKKTNKNKIIFTIIGSIESRKGQDIIIDSLNYLNDDIISKIEIWIVGRTLDIEYKKTLIEKIGDKNNFVLLKGEMQHHECINIIYDSDIIINASRDEPLSVALVEAFCLAKACLVSGNTGIAELIKDKKNGFIYKHEDSKDLSEKIKYIVKNYNSIEDVGINARKTYLEFLSMNVIQEKWNDYIEKVIN